MERKISEDEGSDEERGFGLMARLMKWTVLALILLALPGCWDLKNIQDINYITAVGIDYKDGKYLLYAQLLDFSNVAKQEGGGSRQNASIWVGKGEGQTISEAINDLYNSSQQKTFWGHVTCIVLSEEALKQRNKSEFMDGIVRFREMRYTQWVYGTQEPIDKLLTTKPFFNLSPLSSILAQPEDLYRQDSLIRPMRLYKVVTDYREPGQTLLLPRLSIDSEDWQRDGKLDPKLMIDGIMPVYNQQLKMPLDIDKLAGLRWLLPDMTRAPVQVPDTGKPSAMLYVKEKTKSKVRVQGDKVLLDLEAGVRASVVEMSEQISETELKKETEKSIRKELEQTFKLGKERNIDLFQVEHILYRTKFPDWSRLTSNGERPLADYELGNLKFTVNIIHTGMYKEVLPGKDY
jgi:spore germination protein KC